MKAKKGKLQSYHIRVQTNTLDRLIKFKNLHIHTADITMIVPKSDKEIRLKKNIRVQILSKINKEGWIFSGRVDPIYYFYSEDRSMRLEFIHSAPVAEKLVVVFYKSVLREEIGKSYEPIVIASYKDYIRWGSQCILTEALL
jgi:hypothetical protein